MHKPPHAPRSSSVRISLKELTVAIPTVMGLVGFALLLGVPLGLTYQAAVEMGRKEPERWTVGAERAPTNLAVAVVKGTLPPADPRQRIPPCAEEIGEEEIGGVCWIRLDVRPPCPKGLAWERNAKCYARVLEVKPLPRPPTSGGELPVGVSAPE